jgi:hypothetical protein
MNAFTLDESTQVYQAARGAGSVLEAGELQLSRDAHREYLEGVPQKHVRELARFMHEPMMAHEVAMQNAIRYLLLWKQSRRTRHKIEEKTSNLRSLGFQNMTMRRTRPQVAESEATESRDGRWNKI